MRLFLATLATLAMALVVKAEETALAANATITDAAVEEAAFEPNTIVNKHIGGDLLVLSVFSETKPGEPYPKSPEECQDACKKRKGCNAWLFCASLDGCAPGPGDSCSAHLSNSTLPAAFGKFGTVGGNTDPCVGEDKTRYPPDMCALKAVPDAAAPPDNDPGSRDWMGGTVDPKWEARKAKEAKAAEKAAKKEEKAAKKEEEKAAEKPAAAAAPAETPAPAPAPAAAAAAPAAAATGAAVADAAVATTKPAPAAADCEDAPTPDQHSCAQQKEWGKCAEAWLVDGGYCRATCGACPATAADAKAAPAPAPAPAAAPAAADADAAAAPAASPVGGVTTEEKGQDGALYKGGVVENKA